jgi:hypothetical protein
MLRITNYGDSALMKCTLRLRHGNQGQLSVIEIDGGDIAAVNLGKVASYSSGGW